MDAVSSRVLLGVAGSSQNVWGAVNITGPLLCCVWTGDRFLAAGARGKVATSADGSFWSTTYATNTLTTSLTGSLNGASNNTTTMVLVGSDGRVYTSPMTAGQEPVWSQRTSGTAVSLNDVAWDSTQFIAVGAGGTVLSSPDGITWTPQTSGVAVSLNGVAWTGAQFVAVGGSGTIITSSDGITWTPQTSGVADTLNKVASSGALLVATGDSNKLLTSPDGVTWTQRTSSITGSPRLFAVTWTGSAFVVGAYPGISSGNTSTDTTYSADGATWTKVTIPLWELGGIAWSGSVLAYAGQQVKTNTTWTTEASLISRDAFPLPVEITTITSTPSGFFAVAGINCYTTTTGTNWAFTGNMPVSYATNQIIWNGSLFVAACDSGVINTSTDAVTWTNRTPDTGQKLNGVAWSGSAFVVVGGDSAGHIRSSADAITWTTRTSNSTAPLRAVAWGNSIFVAVGDSGRIVTSTAAGTTWTARTSGLSTDYIIADVTYGNGKFVAVAYSLGFPSARAVLTSTNGTAWTVTNVTATVTQPMDAVAAVTGGFVAAGWENLIYTSLDGLSWTQAPYTGGGRSFAGATQNLNAVSTNGSKTIAVGDIGQLYMANRPATPPYPTV